MFNHEIKLSLLFAVEIVKVVAMRAQLLCGEVLKNSPEVRVDFANHDIELKARRIHASQQTDVVQKQLEQIALFVEFQRHTGLVDIISGQGNTRVGYPKEAVLVFLEFRPVVQRFKDKPLVLGVEFRRNPIENLLDGKLVVGILGNVLFVQLYDILLLVPDILHVVGFQIFANRQQNGYKTMHLALHSLLIRLIAFLFWFGKSQILLDFRSFICTFAQIIKFYP